MPGHILPGSIILHLIGLLIYDLAQITFHSVSYFDYLFFPLAFVFGQLIFAQIF